jgi:hypothetical protein
VKLRPTLLIQNLRVGMTSKEVDMPIDYCLGKDIHFIVLSRR